MPKTFLEAIYKSYISNGILWNFSLLVVIFLGVEWDWLHLIRRPLTGLLYQPWAIDECGAVSGIRISNENRNTWRLPALTPICPPKMPHDLTWAQTRAAAVESRRLTAWAMARPSCFLFAVYITRIFCCNGRNCTFLLFNELRSQVRTSL
jgi:hypothetical protein